MNPWASIFALVIIAVLCGCHSSQKGSDPTAGRARIGADTGAAAHPSKKEIIAEVLSNLDIRLDSHSSCVGVGSSFDDRTLRDYLSGLLETQTDFAARNWVEVECHPYVAGATNMLWQCRVVFHTTRGEIRSGWGVDFLLDPSSKRAIRESFRCTGGG